MGSLGWPELVVIMLFALVVFGPKRLPEIARQIGKAIRELRRVSTQFQDEIRTGLALDDESFPYMRPKPPAPPPAPPPAVPGAQGQAPDVVRYGEVRPPAPEPPPGPAS